MWRVYISSYKNLDVIALVPVFKVSSFNFVMQRIFFSAGVAR